MAEQRASEAYTLLGRLEKELKEVRDREILLAEALSRQEMQAAGPAQHVPGQQQLLLCRMLLHIALEHSSRQSVRGLALRVLSDWRLRQYTAMVYREKEAEAHVVVCKVQPCQPRSAPCFLALFLGH